MLCILLAQRLMKTRSTGDKAVIKFEIPEECKKFENIYDDLQRKLSKVSLTNELLAGNQHDCLLIWVLHY